MSDVIEQGPTRWARPSDYGGPPPNWNGGGDRRRPSGLPEPKYPRNPAPAPGKRVPGVTPKWSPISPNPLRPPKGGVPFNFRNPAVPAGRVPLGGIIGGVGLALELAGLLDDYFRPPQWFPRPNPANGWYLYGRCANPPMQAYLSSSNTQSQPACLTGQATTVYDVSPPQAPPLTAVQWSVWTQPAPSGAGVYKRHVESWRRPLATNNAPHMVVPAMRMPSPAPNPNYARSLPSERPVVVGHASPLPQPKPYPYADPNLGYDGREFGFTKGGPVGRPIPPRLRVPPRKHEREGKAMSASKKFLIAFSKILDEISETAELIDALFEALPEDTQKKWKCNRNTPFLDNAGQYGIDNADCKAKALWNNWHKVDPEKAVENIIKNHIYDKVVGAIHRQLPRNTGGALDDAFRAIDKKLQGYLDDIVDF